jgi:hypothetical protein
MRGREGSTEGSTEKSEQTRGGREGRTFLGIEAKPGVEKDIEVLLWGGGRVEISCYDAREDGGGRARALLSERKAGMAAAIDNVTPVATWF